MASPRQWRIPAFGAGLQAMMVAVVFTAFAVNIPVAQAQTYQVIHNFTGGADGADPQAGLAIDQRGNLYGTATGGGSGGAGTVFKLAHAGSSWPLTPLYGFSSGYDGSYPLGPVTIGPDGSLYGTTLAGGSTQGRYCEDGGCGVVFRLRPSPTPPPAVFTPWQETVLIAFDATDGNEPVYPQLLFDQTGNLYGTTQFGGGNIGGNVFELTPSGGSWTETVLYDGFGNGATGDQPLSGVVMDSTGNLYGTTSVGGAGGDGVVYELSPTQYGYVQTILHSFSNGDDGGLPYGGLVMDQGGNLYGGTVSGGSAGCGVIYELSPSNGGWTFTTIFAFSPPSCAGGPFETLTLDAAGNLYGTAYGDGANGFGMVFKLSQSNGIWTLTDLHDFSSGTEYFPYGAVTLGADGNLYGTASEGGAYGHGVVWEITP
ncbi:MAG: choice-of-anchor tandem repeat GloVer-containing protein [Candidatus Korobacteraceae bacterium]